MTTSVSAQTIESYNQYMMQNIDTTDSEFFDDVSYHTNVVSGNSQPFNYKQSRYWKRYKVLRTYGWTALGVGVPGLFFSYIAVIASSIGEGDNTKVAIAGTCACLSAGLIVSSVPTLTLAYINRKKAKKLDVGIGKIKSAVSPVVTFTPSFSLSYSF